MSPMKDFDLTYEVLNIEGTFSEGDTIRGTVTFTLEKETKVKSLQVKLKGDADVQWTQGSGEHRNSYKAHRRYFKLKENLIGETTEGTVKVLPKGDHQFKFSLTIPQGDMPSSFKGKHGRIVYLLEAKISRSWRLPSKLKTEISFVSKSLLRTSRVMCPQSGSVDKTTGVFSKGQVEISATVDRKVCSPGDTLSVVSKAHNSSSKNMKPKFSLNQLTTYFADHHTETSDTTLLKMVGDTIAPNSNETVSCEMTVPADAIPTLYHCDIISVEYYIKVYLDISFAVDPEVVFPLVVVPSSSAALGEGVGPYPAGTVGGPSYSDFPPPAFPAD